MLSRNFLDPLQSVMHHQKLVVQFPEPIVNRVQMAHHFRKPLVVLSQLLVDSIKLRLEDFLIEIK